MTSFFPEPSFLQSLVSSTMNVFRPSLSILPSLEKVSARWEEGCRAELQGFLPRCLQPTGGHPERRGSKAGGRC